MKNISYQNDELLRKLFRKMTPDSPSSGFTERVMDLIILPEVDMSAHQQTINKLLWTIIASIAVLIPVLFFLLDWSIFDLFPKAISAENFNRFIIFLSNIPDFLSSLLNGLKQYSFFFVILAAGIGLLLIDSLLNKSLIRGLFPFNMSAHEAK